MFRTRLIVVAATLTPLLSAPLAAQTCSTNPCTVQVTASATVNDVMKLTLSGITADLGTPTDVDYTAGFKEAAGPTATVQSNRPWHVDVVGNNTTKFTYAGSFTDPNKAASDLKWGTVSGTYGNNMSSSAVLKTGATGSSGTAQQIFFKTLWAWTSDVPGTYSLVVNFTVAGP
jgi:hypothetical protein